MQPGALPRLRTGDSPSFHREVAQVIETLGLVARR